MKFVLKRKLNIAERKTSVLRPKNGATTDLQVLSYLSALVAKYFVASVYFPPRLERTQKYQPQQRCFIMQIKE
jgi:hypothetical protein